MALRPTGGAQNLSQSRDALLLWSPGPPRGAAGAEQRSGTHLVRNTGLACGKAAPSFLLPSQVPSTNTGPDPGPGAKRAPGYFAVYRTLVLINTDQLIRKARDPAGREETPVLRTVFFFFFFPS